MSETWAYYDANTIDITGDVTTRYWAGQVVSVTQSGTVRYFVITAVNLVGGNTRISVNGGGIYTLANTAITVPRRTLPPSLKTYFDGFYATLGGRSGGQTIYGGSGASENLNLGSTSHATKGIIQLNDNTSGLGNIVIPWNANITGMVSKYLGFNANNSYPDISIFHVTSGGVANKNAGLNFLVHGWGYGTDQNFNFSRWSDAGRFLENIEASARINVAEGDSYFNANGGNVGIGITVPTTFLDVIGSQNGSSLRTRSGNAAGVYTGNQILLSYDGSASYSHVIRTRHHSGQLTSNAIDFYLWHYGVDATGDAGTLHVMTLDGNGNVGIGTTAPTAKIHSENNMRIAASTDALLRLKNKTANSGDISFYTYEDAAGGVITFAAIPTFVNGIISTFSSMYGSTGRGASVLDVINGNFNFRVCDTSVHDALYIKNDGTVGIGTTTPLAREHIVGPLSLVGPQTSDMLVLERPYNGGVEFGRAASIKLGTTSTFNDCGRLDFCVNPYGSSIGSPLTTTNLNALATVMTLLGDGKIGIGKPDPACALDVVGDIYASGNCSALSFTDRTEAFIGDALAEIKKIKATAKGAIDHNTLPKFARRSSRDEKGKPKLERNIGNMVSVLTVAVQQLIEQNEKLAARIAVLEGSK